jgi:hypothetical protein
MEIFYLLKRFKKLKVPRKKKRKNKKISYKDYSRMCKFKFKAENYPLEFDISMIERYGWYGYNNSNGLSHDHMFSISNGWKEDIPPRIMRHPANCKLMLYEENQQKGNKSSINLQELLKKIKEWNKKYK